MASDGYTTLVQAVRGRIVLKYFGLLCLSFAGVPALPLVVSLVVGEHELALRHGLVLGALVGLGAGLGRTPPPARVQTNEILSVVALAFLATAALMSFPLMAEGLSVADALFESVSAITTTGLTTLERVEGRSLVFLFTRAWMQWYGGLAIVVLALSLVIEPGIFAKRFGSVQIDMEDVAGSARTRARRLLALYLAFTAAGCALLWIAGASGRDAVVHALSAISTGGFSTHDDSLAGAGGRLVQATAILISLAGAGSFSLYDRVRRAGWRAFAGDREFRALLLASLVVSALIASTLVLVEGRPWREGLVDGPLVALSAQTTTGFTTLPIGELDAASKGVLLVAMGIGGDLGSTAGGIKIIRLLILLGLVRTILLRALLPSHAVVETRVAGRPMDDAAVHNGVAVVFLFLIVILVSWLAFLVSGYDPLDSLFEVVSATGTVGLSTGVADTALAFPLKGVLMLDMLLGRLEVVALLVLVSPLTWFGRRSASP